MAVTYTLRCPECAHKFKSRTIDGPDKCPACGVSMQDDEGDGVIEIKAPFLASAATRAIDDSYRQLERSSEIRMEKAAQDAGCSVSDMSALKITDIKTGVKQGESYMPEVRNEVTQQMDLIKARGGQAGFTGEEGLGYSAAVQTGPAPNAGAKMRTSLQNIHAQHTGGMGVSERPALETLQPGYRRRG